MVSNFPCEIFKISCCVPHDNTQRHSEGDCSSGPVGLSRAREEQRKELRAIRAIDGLHERRTEGKKDMLSRSPPSVEQFQQCDSLTWAAAAVTGGTAAGGGSGGGSGAVAGLLRLMIVAAEEQQAIPPPCSPVVVIN